MIILKCLIYGKSIKIECENEDVCAVFQYRLNDVLDVRECDKNGCPENCKYIVREEGDDPFFICNVITREIKNE